jgi:hypothetical protein
MSDDVLDIDDLLETPNDERFIAGIFNYCNRRCDRCAFADRCRLHADEQRERAAHPDESWAESVERSLERTIELMRRWCDRQGIDFDKVSATEAESADVAATMQLIEDARQDPLQKLAEEYTTATLKLTAALRPASAFNRWPAEARAAVDTIEWFAMPIASKIHRALAGCARRLEEPDDDPRQSDWNGSAKVARLDIAESVGAWSVLIAAGEAPADSPVRQIADHLRRLDIAVAERFPDAMQFVRPGFDEGDNGK